ncbi:MAG: riboflavin synthase [Candidatus Symbiobacter sp.]|nr:riboflavin synthase [Candidatus Symbiobacter sp.]
MFTGIITGQARIAKIGKIQVAAKPGDPPRWGDVRLVLDQITGAVDYNASAIGASIACSGVCLTLIEKGTESDGWGGTSGLLDSKPIQRAGTDGGGLTLSFDVSQETLDKTTLKDWQIGQKINLESSLRFGDELGGHMVAGHVDTPIAVLSRKPVAGSTEFFFALPPEGRGLIVPKGSVALDGVSLTVNQVESDRFSVMIIPHTAAVTGFGQLQAGDAVNLEYDMVGRYMVRQMALYQGK